MDRLTRLMEGLYSAPRYEAKIREDMYGKYADFTRDTTGDWVRWEDVENLLRSAEGGLSHEDNR
jgi:hypothetical protein